jgi:hypothetical protein
MSALVLYVETKAWWMAQDYYLRENSVCDAMGYSVVVEIYKPGIFERGDDGICSVLLLSLRPCLQESGEIDYRNVQLEMNCLVRMSKKRGSIET